MQPHYLSVRAVTARRFPISLILRPNVMTEEDDTDFLRLVEEYYSQKPDFARLYPGAQASNPDKSTFTADMPVHQKEEEAGGRTCSHLALLHPWLLLEDS